ncbi:hypothetical protein N9L47_08510, partial [Rhodobacteraceae bacterium]|nr:hypothetical protein [Paracoccaceae bacterium]
MRRRLPIRVFPMSSTRPSAREDETASPIPSTQPNATGSIISALPVMEASLRAQGIDGLIGRDVLDLWVSNYMGPTKQLV